MSEEAIKVFISYSWDSNEHKKKVLALSESLRKDGINCQIDRYHQSPPEGWYRWMMDQLEESDFVLVVCTKKYNLRYRNKEKQGQGKGVIWEGGLIIEELYNGQGINDKYIPVLLSPEGSEHIPRSLQTYTIYRLLSNDDYDLNTQGDYQNLYRHLTKQPAYIPAQLGKPQILLPASGASSTVGGHGEIIQAEDQTIATEEAEWERTQREQQPVSKLGQLLQQQPWHGNRLGQLLDPDQKEAREKAKREQTQLGQQRQAEEREMQRQAECLKQQEAEVAERQQQQKLEQQRQKEELRCRLTPRTDEPTSEREIDYAQLQGLLKVADWKGADQETRNIVFKVCNRFHGETLESENIRQLPDSTFLAIDQLWLIHSEGHFGFSTQQTVWHELENLAGVTYKIFQRFSQSVGWYEADSWVKYENLNFSLKAPLGHLPYCRSWITPTRPTATAQRFHALMLKVRNLEENS